MYTKLYQSLDFSWDFVVSLFWHRYPNPYSTHVLSEDVIERRMLPDGNLYTKRIIVKKGGGKIPLWLRRRLTGKHELVVEESLINPWQRRASTWTRNVGGLAKYAVVTEACSYSPDVSTVHQSSLTSSPNEVTKICRLMSIDSALASRIFYPLYMFLKHRYKVSAEASLKGYEYICKLYSNDSCEAVTQTRQFLPHGLRESARKHARTAREFAAAAKPCVVAAESGEPSNCQNAESPSLRTC